jgi:RNA polymerase sigma factor for flagellar operon FliA
MGRSIPKFNRADLHALIRDYQVTGDVAVRNRVIEACQPMVVKLAAMLQAKLTCEVDVEDLIQAGTFGLIQAIDRFDPSNGTAFTSYASHRVVGAMYDEVREFDPVPRLTRHRARMVAVANDLFLATFGYAPTPEELRTAMRLDDAAFDKVIHDQPIDFERTSKRIGGRADDPERGYTVGDTLVDKKSTPVSLHVEAEDMLGYVGRAIGKDEEKLLRLYYIDELTMKQIANEHEGLSESRVSQKFSKIYARVRACLGESERRRAA